METARQALRAHGGAACSRPRTSPQASLPRSWRPARPCPAPRGNRPAPRASLNNPGRRSHCTSAAAPVSPEPTPGLGPYSSRCATGAGEVTIRLLSQSDIREAGVLLARAFVGGSERWAFDDINGHLRDMVAPRSPSAVLVAELDEDPDSESDEEDETPPPRSPGLRRKKRRKPRGRMVGLVSVYLTEEGRETFPTLQPPDGAAYLCNMAVAVGRRRNGVASALVRAAEELAASHGARELALHVALKNGVARALYEKAGYREVARDGLLARARGISPRSLMVKQLGAGGS